MKQTNSQKVRRDRYSIGPSIVLSTPLLFVLCGGRASDAARAADASPTPAAQASATIAPQAPDEMGTLIAAGNLPGLCWSNFSDVLADVA
jgi:hypothetical protein